MGYHRAGFDVVGVDLSPQPFYPFQFHQGDAMEVLAEYLAGESTLGPIDAVHASPPCQAFSTMGARWRGKGGKADENPDLLTPTLELLRDHRAPWVVENVAGAKSHMPNAFILSGAMFGLGVHRPRYFVSNVLILTPRRYPPPPGSVGVYGRTHDGRRVGNKNAVNPQRAASSLEEAQSAMGMDWADWHGTKEAIPPAYSEYIGAQLLRAVEVARR